MRPQLLDNPRQQRPSPACTHLESPAGAGSALHHWEPVADPGLAGSLVGTAVSAGSPEAPPPRCFRGALGKTGTQEEVQ